MFVAQGELPKTDRRLFLFGGKAVRSGLMSNVRDDTDGSSEKQRDIQCTEPAHSFPEIKDTENQKKDIVENNSTRDLW